MKSRYIFVILVWNMVTSIINQNVAESHVEGEDEILFRQRRAALNFYQTPDKLQGSVVTVLQFHMVDIEM